MRFPKKTLLYGAIAAAAMLWAYNNVAVVKKYLGPKAA